MRIEVEIIAPIILALLFGGWRFYVSLKKYVDGEVAKEREKCKEEKEVLQKQIDILKVEVFDRKLDIFNNSIHCMWIKSVNGTVLDVNPSFLKFIAAKASLTKSDIIGKKMDTLFPALTQVTEAMDAEVRKTQRAVYRSGVKVFNDDTIKYGVIKELMLMNYEAVLFGMAITE